MPIVCAIISIKDYYQTIFILYDLGYIREIICNKKSTINKHFRDIGLN